MICGEVKQQNFDMNSKTLKTAFTALLFLSSSIIGLAQESIDSITCQSPGYSITKNDGTKYYIVIKQEKIGKNKYSEYVDAFVIKDGKKIVVSVYDGGDDLDDCGMEVQYKAQSNMKKGQTFIRYDEEEQMLYIPRVSFKGELSKKECNVFKFDGKMFVRVGIDKR